jgi:hypothetical protein
MISTRPRRVGNTASVGFQNISCLGPVPDTNYMPAIPVIAPHISVLPQKQLPAVRCIIHHASPVAAKLQAVSGSLGPLDPAQSLYRLFSLDVYVLESLIISAALGG